LDTIFSTPLVSNEIILRERKIFLVRGSKFYPADKSHALHTLRSLDTKGVVGEFERNTGEKRDQ
jgi:hypothetical protein